MVEPSREYFDMRGLTPTPKQSVHGGTHETHRNEQDSSPSSSSSPVINTASCQPITESDPRPLVHFVDHPAMDNAQKEPRDSPLSVPDRVTGEVTTQARSDTHSGRVPYSPFPTASSNVRLPPRPSDNMHSTMAPHRHPSPRFNYGQGAGYNQPVYTVPTQPASYTPPFAVFPPTHHSTESRVTPQNAHIRYQPMFQPHILYYPHPSPAQIPSHFQSVRYQPPLSPQFIYPPQPFQRPPTVYHAYPPHQPYVSSEGETQGAWYYLPHGVQQHMEGNTVRYPGHYPGSYPPFGPSDMETTNSPSLAPQNPAVYPWSGSQGPARNPEPATSSRLRTTPPKQPPGISPVSPAGTEQAEGGSGAGTATSFTGRRQEKPLVRRPYHPNPPPDRSEWVMWVGNIPSDATYDEVQMFFSQPVTGTLGDNTTPASTGQIQDNGVLSIFLISKSSCVFVNYRAEEHLTRAIERFNGKSLRTRDPRSPRLVCRVRRRDDDLKAGVGGQRGQGLHVRWVKDQKLREKQMQSEAPASGEPPRSQASGSDAPDWADDIASQTSGLTLSDDTGEKWNIQPRHRSSSGSFASTDSSFLSNFFPKRYFILKSLTQYDLDISVQQGLWATQKHNEGILDRAYRTSNEVYLIFGVNKSGEFYGYARMAGAVQHGEQNVPWASRTKDAVQGRRHSRQSSQLSANATLPQPTSVRSNDRTPHPSEAPSAFDALSPTGSVSLEDGGISVDSRSPDASRDLNSAPGHVERYRQLSMAATLTKSITIPATEFELGEQAPLRAMRVEASPVEMGSTGPSSFIPGDQLYQIEDEADADVGSLDEQETTWGDCFKVEWLCTERLPFYWTRNLRNHWNHDREVKISRDGTELEPSVGEKLLNAWQVMKAEGGEVPPTYSGQSDGTRKGGHTRRQNVGGRPGPDQPPKGPMRS